MNVAWHEKEMVNCGSACPLNPPTQSIHSHSSHLLGPSNPTMMGKNTLRHFIPLNPPICLRPLRHQCHCFRCLFIFFPLIKFEVTVCIYFIGSIVTVCIYFIGSIIISTTGFRTLCAFLSSLLSFNYFFFNFAFEGFSLMLF